MKKIFLYGLLFAFVGLLSACKNDKNNPDEQDSNSYPYLRVSDLMPLELLSISQAETKLANMGYTGGWQKYIDEDGYQEEGYLYTSKSKKDTIVLDTDPEYGVVTVVYKASKGVIPSEARAWLSHVPEKVTIPQKAIEISGKQNLTFSSAWTRSLIDGEIIANTNKYSEYLEMTKDISSGIDFGALWGTLAIDSQWPSGYYGGALLFYSYENNRDYAAITIAFYHHEQNDNKPLDN